MSANQGTDNPSLLQSPNQFSVRTNVVSMGKAGLLLPSATVMLASCVSPLAHTDQLPDQGQMTANAHQYDEQQNGLSSLLSTTYIFLLKLSCPVLIRPYWILTPYHNSLFGSYCLLIPSPSYLVYFVSKDSLSEHNSTLSLCLGRGLSRTARIPIKRLLQHL